MIFERKRFINSVCGNILLDIQLGKMSKSVWEGMWGVVGRGGEVFTLKFTMSCCENKLVCCGVWNELCVKLPSRYVWDLQINQLRL